MSLDLNFDIDCDCAVSLGKDCKVAEALRRNDLRKFSSPFDWLTDYSLENFYDFLVTNGKGLFKGIINIPKHDRKEGYTYGVRDSETRILSMHDFLTDIPFEKTYNDAIKKGHKRFVRLNRIFKKAQTVCFVSNRENEPDDFIKLGEKLNKRYRFKKIYFVNVISNEEEAFKFYTKGNIVFYEFSFNDVHEDGNDIKTNPYFWKGNMKKWDNMLKHIHITNNINFNREKKVINLGLFKISFHTGT